MIDERFFKRTEVRYLSDLVDIPSIAKLITDKSGLTLEAEIHSVATLKDANASQLSFFDNKKYKDDFLNSSAGFCLAKPDYKDIAPKTMQLIPSHDPYRLYALIAAQLYENLNQENSRASDYSCDDYGAYIHKNASLEKNVITARGVVIEAEAVIGSGTIIKANSVIGRGCHIGRNCLIDTNVSISHALIGDFVVISSGARIGQEGFGFAMGVTHQPVPQLGRVILQDRVNLGANSCIDRGTLKDTIIGEGTCIDNMVQVGHGVVMGVHCIVAGNTSIAGSVVFGDYVVCGGHACVAGHLQIDSNSRIAGAAAVTRDVKSGQTVAGYPAINIKTFFRNTTFLNKIASKGAKS